MGLYTFQNSSDASALLTRLRRLDRTSPRLRAGKFQQTASNFAPVVQSVMDDNQNILLSSPLVSKKGSVAPVYNNMGFGIVANPTNATIYWDGINGGSTRVVIHRADGTQQAIPAGFITVTGLAASTTYYALPYWSPYSSCTVGWVVGTVGVPPILFSSITDLTNAWQQNQQNREPLTNTYLTFTTPAPASPPVNLIPTTPKGGPLRCVMVGTEIEAIDGTDYEEQLFKCSEWWRIETECGKWLNCTPDHPLYTADGHRQDASLFQYGETICHREGDCTVSKSEAFTRLCTKVAVTMPKIHLFWANGFLSHNIKMDPQIDS